MPNFSILKNYFLVTVRALYREKVYAGINILGLALAVACCLILALYVRSELTYDQHNEKYKDIYRVTVDFTSDGGTNRYAINSLSLGPLLLKKYPNIGEFVRFSVGARTVFRHEGIEINWDDVLFTDTNVFNVFSHTAIYGDLTDALVDPSSIAISERFSRAYFGDRNPIGETIGTDGKDFTVSVVFKDLPENSHLKYSALISMNLREAVYGQRDDDASPRYLFGVSYFTYFLLSKDNDQNLLQRLLNEFYDSEAAEIGREIGLTAKYFTQNLTDIHFQSGLKSDMPTGNIFYVYGFMAVALFVLLVACINYTNLATARTTKRSKEVGMRKVIGAERSQLIIQFIGESLIYVSVAVVLGFIFVQLAESQTSLNSLMGKGTLLELADEPEILLWLIAGAIGVALLAGAYPAIYLSSITPISAITANRNVQGAGLKIRQVLVFLQFFVSVTVLACTLIMQQQMQYVANKSLGFNKENKISVMIKGADTIAKIQLIKNELIKNTRITGFSKSSYVPGQNVGTTLMQIENNDGQLEGLVMSHMAVDKEFVDVMDIEIVEGRDFTKQLLTDRGMSVIVNETLVKKMGWEKPIRKRIQFGLTEARVIGVMKDFHFRSLHEAVAPIFLRPFPKEEFSRLTALQKEHVSRWVIINVAGDNIHQSINYIDSVISKFDAKHPFEYKFVDDLLDEHYLDEVNLMKLTSIFSAICIFISCMGLYGLAAFTTEQRTKEIGIRKVLGASTLQIVLMLARKMIYMVLVAATIASVVSYYVMNDSLSVFAYRTDIQMWTFVLATSIVALVAFFTVAIQSGKTASSNPVDSIRYE